MKDHMVYEATVVYTFKNGIKLHKRNGVCEYYSNGGYPIRICSKEELKALFKDSVLKDIRIIKSSLTEFYGD